MLVAAIFNFLPFTVPLIFLSKKNDNQYVSEHARKYSGGYRIADDLYFDKLYRLKNDTVMFWGKAAATIVTNTARELEIRSIETGETGTYTVTADTFSDKIVIEQLPVESVAPKEELLPDQPK